MYLCIHILHVRSKGKKILKILNWVKLQEHREGSIILYSQQDPFHVCGNFLVIDAFIIYSWIFSSPSIVL